TKAATQAFSHTAKMAFYGMPLIGAGGVENGVTALANIKAGASAVQLYSALIFQGPSLPAQIADELDGLLAAEGFDHVSQAVGAA
ncbi:MAG TPA: dihydroorotate dehydrogenase (quinone), partial [Terricaulis sp.]|nr:dihydroorotate dehydrogenase (quinone) [Terricaulis sp.]